MTRLGVFMGLIGAAAGAMLPLADQSQAFWQLECPVYPPSIRCRSRLARSVRPLDGYGYSYAILLRWRAQPPSPSFSTLTPEEKNNNKTRLVTLARPVLSRRSSTSW